MDKSSIVEAATNAGAVAVFTEDATRRIVTLSTDIRRYEGGRPYRVRENGDLELVEKLLSHPLMRRGTTTFYEALSFSRFVKRYKSVNTVVFADAIGRKFTGALDYHPAGSEQVKASWDLFRAVLPLRHTPSWEIWAAANGKPMDQASFAQFLEDNIPDIAQPAGADLVELSRTLEAKMDVQFESHIRADNGAHRFSYIENVSGSSQGPGGRIEVPRTFTLVLQPFEGSKQYAVEARLRYRITSKKLSLWFDLVRLQDVLTEAFNDELMKISAELGDDVPIYNAPAPEALTPPRPTNGE